MLFLNKIKNKTFLSKIVKLNVQKRFYPQGNVNSITQGVRLLLSKPLVASSLPLINTPKSITKIFPTICYYPIYHKSNFNKPKQNVLLENSILENTLSTILKEKKESIQEKKVSDKPQILTSFSNKKYETYITTNTTVNDLTDEELIKELEKREMIKLDPGNTAVKIKLEDGTEHLVGTSKHKIKLSSLGQAYNEKCSQPTFGNKVTKDLRLDICNLRIIVPPEVSSDLFMETGTHKHLLVILDAEGNVFSLGYLTSKLSGQKICDIQFKKFQDQKENIKTDIIKPNEKEKKQSIVFFDNLIEIDKKDIKYVKNDIEYLNGLSKEAGDLLEYNFDKKKLNPSIIYNKNGITKEQFLDICKEHDKIAQDTKVKHPLSADQIKQNEINKLKQKNKHLSTSEENS